MYHPSVSWAPWEVLRHCRPWGLGVGEAGPRRMRSAPPRSSRLTATAPLAVPPSRIPPSTVRMSSRREA